MFSYPSLYLLFIPVYHRHLVPAGEQQNGVNGGALWSSSRLPGLLSTPQHNIFQDGQTT